MQRFIEKKPMLSASTDAIRAATKSMTTANQNPRLFKANRGSFASKDNVARMSQNVDQTLKFELDEAEETWKATSDFVKHYVRDGRDVVIEGIGALPSKLVELPFEFRAVFIVNLNDRTDAILNHARENEYDWLRKYDDNVIRAFCHFNQAWNHYYAEEAAKFGFEVVNINTDQFDQNINDAVEALL